MVCYACHLPATVACPRCNRIYCLQHGAAVCAVCASPASAFPSGALYRSTLGASVALLLLSVGYILWWPEFAPVQPRTVLAGAGSGARPDGSTSPRSQVQGGGSVTEPAPEASQTPSVVPTPAPPRKYSVAAGDTLVAIALQFDTTVAELMRLNGLSDAGSLNIGQELIVSMPAAPADPADPASPTPPRTYTVAAGDTPLGIALRFNITVEELIRLNNLTDTSLLGIGQKLTVSTPIPATATPAASATASPTVPSATATPAAPPAATPTIAAQPSPAPAQARTHTVVTGDTLVDIAARYGLTVDEIVRLNGLTNAADLSIGQELALTPDAATAGSSAATPSPSAAPRTYAVVAGDTLYDIAAREGTTVDELMRLNGLSNSSRLSLGQELTLP